MVFGFGVYIVTLLHYLLELWSGPRPDNSVPCFEVVGHEAEDRVLVALGVDGIALALNAAVMILLKLIGDDIGQSMEVIFHFDGTPGHIQPVRSEM